MPIPLIIACAAGIALLSSCGVIGGRDSDDNNVDPADDDTGIDPPDDTGDDDTGDPLPGPDYDKDGDGYVDGSLPSEDLQALVADGTVTADQILPQNLDCGALPQGEAWYGLSELNSGSSVSAQGTLGGGICAFVWETNKE